MVCYHEGGTLDPPMSEQIICSMRRALLQYSASPRFFLKGQSLVIPSLLRGPLDQPSGMQRPAIERSLAKPERSVQERPALCAELLAAGRPLTVAACEPVPVTARLSPPRRSSREVQNQDPTGSSRHPRSIRLLISALGSLQSLLHDHGRPPEL